MVLLARPETEKSIFNKTKKNMESLGVYRKEFDPLIEIYASMMVQYKAYAKMHADEQFNTSEITVNSKGVVNEKKSPLVQTLETLRKDILSYSDRLCLNPKALTEDKLKTNKAKPVGLDAFVSQALGDGSG